ncbi:MAG TPA: hypothetical protein VGM24_06050 [Puia sp.]|jgi:hypothetical protein
MKQDVMPSIVRMDQETLKKLTTEVKETLATGYDSPKAKSRFHSVNLWNIHRNWKLASRISGKRGI